MTVIEPKVEKRCTQLVLRSWLQHTTGRSQRWTKLSRAKMKSKNKSWEIWIFKRWAEDEPAKGLKKKQSCSRETTLSKRCHRRHRNNSRWTEWSIVLNVVERRCKINEGRKVSSGCDYKDAGSNFCSESSSIG